MALTLAERSKLIAPSATIAMGTEAKRLKAEGIDVLDFALGEPDFPTPPNIQEAAIRAMRSGQTHYTPPAGIAELRQAIAEHYTRHHGLPTQAAQVVVESGTASVSMIQRRLRVGYTRAGRLIDMLERRGIISGYEGSKPRRVLVSESELHTV